MTIGFQDLLIGFLAAAIAVVLVHQVLVLAFNKAGFIATMPWSPEPIGPWGVPTIVNSIFWGGVWGAIYALVEQALPGGEAWIKGWLFGLLMALVSNFTLLPLIKGQPVFMGGDARKIIAVLVILSGFGIATALLYDALRGMA